MCDAAVEVSVGLEIDPLIATFRSGEVRPLTKASSPVAPCPAALGPTPSGPPRPQKPSPSVTCSFQQHATASAAGVAKRTSAFYCLCVFLDISFFNMEDIYHWIRRGDAIKVRMWLDDTEHDMNQG